MNTVAIRKEININTVAIAVGFLGTFAGLVTVWNSVQYRQDDFQRWINAHDTLHDTVGAQLKILGETDAGRDKALLDVTFRLGQLERSHESVEARINRITESYGNQFTEMRGALSSISTQLALTNQTLQRLEAGASAPKPSSMTTGSIDNGK